MAFESLGEMIIAIFKALKFYENSNWTEVFETTNKGVN